MMRRKSTAPPPAPAIIGIGSPSLDPLVEAVN